MRPQGKTTVIFLVGKFSCGKTILRPSSSLNLTRSKAVSSPGYLDSWDKIYSKRKRISLSHGERSAAAAAAVGVPRKQPETVYFISKANPNLQ